MKNPFKSDTGGSFSHSVVVLCIFGIVIVVAIALAIYFYLQYQRTQSQLQNPTQVSEQETKTLIEQVGKLIQLPTSERPTIATVSDIATLKGQTFFAHAKNGDKVLIYAKAQKAILYDPSLQKIIEVGPINVSQKAKTPSVTPTPAPIRLVLYNGTATVGVTSVIEKELKTTQPTMTVVAKENAEKATYIQTIIIDLTGKHKAQAASLAQSLDGIVGALPEGEIKPDNADMLVILGKK